MCLFELGLLVITDAAQETLNHLGIKPLALITRHRKGDWGDVPHETNRANQHALRRGGGLHSSYLLGTQIVRVMTHPQRSRTMICLPSEVALYTSLFSQEH